MHLIRPAFYVLSCIAVTQACHVAEHNTRKKRQVLRNSERQIDITRDVRVYFSKCLLATVGDIWDWNSVVDVSVLDTQWYENSDQSNCSRAINQDNAACWKLRVRNYLRNSSDLIPPVDACIDQFSTDTQNGRRIYISTTISTGGFNQNGICSNVNPNQPQYYPNSPSLRQYSACTTTRTTTTNGRVRLNYPSVFQFFEGHTKCGSEFQNCNNQETETLSLGDPTVPRWPYRMEALLKPESPTLSSVVTCNQEVFPLQDTASAWSVWTDCTASCGGGTRSRSRQCPSSLSDCRSSETENCNTELCQRCRISTASRSSCGTIGGSRAACEALGCCYDLNQCYRAGSSTSIINTFRPTIPPNRVVGGEAGFPGSSITFNCDSRFTALRCAGGTIRDTGSCQRQGCCWQPLQQICYRPRIKFTRVRDDCPAGFTNPPQCIDTNECLSNPCINGATCRDGINGYTCVCPANTQGPNCQTITACTSPPSITNGLFAPVKSSYSLREVVTYTCFFGYTLFNGVAINTCLGGLWSQTTAPSCLQTIATCGIPPFNQNVAYTPSKTVYNVNDVITYSCTNTSPVIGATSNRCIGGTWSNASPTCTGCGTPPVAPNVGYNPVKQSYNNLESVSYTCTNGFGVIGPETNTCRNSMWSAQAPSCTRCNAPPAITMGSYTPTQSTYTVGTQVTYSCNTGLVFAAGSITMITCTNNGWVNPAPTCQAANCPSPPAIPNGAFAPIQTSGIYSIGSVVSYVCMPTFLLIGSASSTCLPLGTWSGTRNCTATVCGIPPGSGTPGLVVSPIKTSYVIGERVTFSCTGGNLLFGSSTNMCLMSGQWLINSPVPTCNLGCTAPPAVVGNLGTFTPMQTAYFNGARVTYSCNFGYKFAVSSNTDNLCDGGWVKSAPTCVPVTCGHPPRPTNGDFFNFVATGIYSVGHIVTYACNALFAIQGVTTNECLGTALWKNAAATCVATHCNQPPLSPNLMVPTSSPFYNFQQVITYTCPSSLVVDGSSTNTCLNTGLWLHRAPLCIDACSPAPIQLTNGLAPSYDQTGITTPDGFVYRSGTVATYTCSTGFAFAFSASLTITCTSGIWNPPIAPQCQAACTAAPTQLANGVAPSYSPAGITTPGGVIYAFGTVATYTCSSGFSFPSTTSATVTCTSGTWNPSVAPQCLQDCSNQPPTNAGVSFNNMKSLYISGDVVTYSCTDASAFLSPPGASNTCQNGAWTSTSPNCIVPM